MDTNQNLVNHSIFGRTYVQQCHGFRDTSQGFVNLHVRLTVSWNSKQHNPKSRKLFHFRSNVRSTVSRILNIYAESRKSSIVKHCIKHVRLNSRVNYRAELLRGRRKGLNRMRMERETPEKQN